MSFAYPEYIPPLDADSFQRKSEGSKRRRSSAIEDSAKETKKRSRTACLQCRSRKSKCGTLPPGPCPNCVELGLPCKWPSEDGRSASARSRRAHGSASGRGLIEGIKPDVLADDALKLESGANWLQTLLAENGDSVVNGHDPHSVRRAPGAAASAALNAPGQAFAQASSGFNADDFVRAVTSHLPTVKEISPTDDAASPASKKKTRIVNVTWHRPCGITAIAPGLKRITLKVRVDTPDDVQWDPFGSAMLQSKPDKAEELHGPGGEVSPTIMRHLLKCFCSHMGAFFPSLEGPTLEAQIAERKGSVFLFNCIASASARFSKHPALALPHVKPHAYGDPFTKVAKSMLGTMMSVPSRDTVTGLLLLALTAAGDDSESEVWMFIGMAARMGLDIGLHIDPPEESDITLDERRLNRLLFWSILMLDHALSFGVGRPTTFPFRGITQTLPTEEDIHYDNSRLVARSALPYAAKLMFLFGSLINALNGVASDITTHEIRGVQEARARAIAEYSLLPQDMQWIMQK